MNTAALIRRDDANLLVSFTEEAIKLRDDALALSGVVGKVTNAEEQSTAVLAQTELQRILNLAEDARVACKAPVLEFGKKIDAAKKAFVADLDAEMLRVSTLVGDFQAVEQAKARAAENARLAELSRLEKEKAEALAKATSHEQIDAIQEHYSNKIAVEAAPPAAPARADGQVVKQDWDITVSNPYELAKYHPACVKIEPRLSEIKQLLNDGVTVKGIVATRVTKSGVRLGKQPAAIEV